MQAGAGIRRARDRARTDERGANLVEYILLVTLIALAVIGAVVFVRGEINRQTVKAGVEIACADRPVPDEDCDEARTLIDNADFTGP